MVITFNLTRLMPLISWGRENTMHRLLSFTLVIVMLIGLTACGDKNASDTDKKEQAQASVLVSKMTEAEKKRTSIHELTLLDKPKEEQDTVQHKVGISFHTSTKQEHEQGLKLALDRGEITQQQYDDMKDRFVESTEPTAVYIDGHCVDVNAFIIQYFAQQDGPLDFMAPDASGADKTVQVSVKNFDEYLQWLYRYRLAAGDSDEQAKSAVKQAELVKDAFANKTYETVPEQNGSVIYGGYDPFADMRSKWEFDSDRANEIKDRIKEISIYDEQLDTEFLVHVVLPKDYDKDKVYPVYFLTDAVWRFGDALTLSKKADEGKCGDVIFVTLGFGYHLDGSNNSVRGQYLLDERAKLLDFITDDLMPYISENFKIDCKKSTLYGHSNGGVFAHYALFNSDKYENQPFGAYIIGSPAFWGSYDAGIDKQTCDSDYGYWDRKQTLDKDVFLCAGSQEDPDYTDLYNGNPTTLEGLSALKERLDKHNKQCKYKLYDSHHYQYIPEMLDEWLTEHYAK